VRHLVQLDLLRKTQPTKPPSVHPETSPGPSGETIQISSSDPLKNSACLSRFS